MNKSSLAVRNCPPANTTRYFLAPRRFDPKDFKAKNFARTYLSADRSVATLLKDAVKILGLNHTPTAIVRNDTGEVVRDLAEVPKDTYLVPCYKVNESAQSDRTAVRLVRNSLPISTIGVKYHLKGMERLLADATKLLRLKEPAKAVFTKTGDPVLNLDNVPSGSVLVISCGEPCVVSVVDDVESSVVSKSELPPELRPGNIYNHLVAFANETVEKRLAMAELSIFASFPPENQERLARYEELSKRLQATRMTGLVEQLVANDIVPPKTESIAGKLKQKCIDLLAKADLQKFRFVISGPRSSGKTSLLYSFACTTLRKLIMCKEERMFMPFVVNWARNALLVDQPRRLYTMFVEAALDGAKYSRFEFVQSLMQVKEYLLSVPFMTAFKKPPEGFEGLSDFVRKMIQCFRESPDSLYAGLVQFPGILANILGFEYPLFIFDHFEQAGEELCAKFARAFRRTPFIIASQIDEAFYEVVKVVDVTFIYTDALVPAKDPSEDQDIISVPELRLQLSESNCLGSPAYMASFYKIVRHLKLVRKQNKYSFVRSKADLSRELIIRQELFKLCVRLEAAGSKAITKTALNKLGDYDEHITIQLLDKAEMRKPAREPTKRSPVKEKPPPPKPEPIRKERKSSVSEASNTATEGRSESSSKPARSKPIFFDSGSESEESNHQDEGRLHFLSQSSDDEPARTKGSVKSTASKSSSVALHDSPKRNAVAPPPKKSPFFDSDSDEESSKRSPSRKSTDSSPSQKRKSLSKEPEQPKRPILFGSSSEDEEEPAPVKASESDHDASQKKDISRRKSLSVPQKGFFDSTDDDEAESPAKPASPQRRDSESGSRHSSQSPLRNSPSPVNKGIFDGYSSDEDEPMSDQKMRPLDAGDLSDGSDEAPAQVAQEHDDSDDPAAWRRAPQRSDYSEGAGSRKKSIPPPPKAPVLGGDDSYYSDEEAPQPAPRRDLLDEYSYSDDAPARPPPKNTNFDDDDYYDEA